MSEGANLVARTSESSPTTLESEGQTPGPGTVVPPSTSSAGKVPTVTTAPPIPTVTTGRRPRFGTGTVQTSPILWVDGRQVRSALARCRRWPPRRVSFPTNDTHLVTGYLEPANPWEHAENVNRADLISTYKTSCLRHSTDPLESVIAQLEKLDISDERCNLLNLRGQTLEQNHCEPLEEILKRVQFTKVDLDGTSLDDESSVALFDMMEYYESATHLIISNNQNIGIRGWQACSRMIKKTQCLEQLEAKNVTLNDQHMPILSRALRLGSHLHVLKLENCGLTGRPIVMLAAALKLNTGLKELYLADNDLGPQDAMQLGALLRTNNHLQLLDVSNNNIQDSGVGHISDGLIEQPADSKDAKGLGILVLWNNHLTRNSSQHFSRAIARSKTLEMLNIGQNLLTNEMLHIIKDSLQQNRNLLRLGMQSTHLSCEAAIALAEIIEDNHVIQRIDLRDNNIQMAGLMALAVSMKKNKSVTQLDLDDRPRRKIEGSLVQYKTLVAEIRGYCARNEEPSSTDESTEESESPQHRSRLSSVSSRKISLTCQTLPRSPPPIPPITPDGSGRTLLEPKRSSGRLRSPAPSPIPSPVASPIPSPSRNRFVVSRVPEAASFTNTSAPSSPQTPPSLGSSLTRFYPPASGASRFRVTVVELANPMPAPKSVVTSTNTNVTVGFKFRVNAAEQANSDDSDDVFDPDVEINPSNPVVAKNTPDLHEGPSVNPSPATDRSTHPSEVTVKVRKTGEKRCVVKDIIAADSKDRTYTEVPEICITSSKRKIRKVSSLDSESMTTDNNVVRGGTRNNLRCEDVTSEQTSIGSETTSTVGGQKSDIKDNTLSAENGSIEERSIGGSTTNNNVTSADNDEVSSQKRSRKNSSLQKHPTSLEKLLGLFQHPGSIFSSSASVDKVEIKNPLPNPLQSSVNSMMALGDKFQQYIREGRGSRESSPQPPLQRSVSDAPQLTTKSDPVKSSSVPQLSSIQALTSVFASCKLEPDVKFLVQDNEKDSDLNGSLICSSNLGTNVENPEALQRLLTLKNRENENTTSPSQCKQGEEEEEEEKKEEEEEEEEEEETFSRISDRPLPENVQSKENNMNTNDDLEIIESVEPNTMVVDSSEIVNSVPVNVLESKQTLCVPKLKDIPEYSVLEMSDSEVGLNKGGGAVTNQENETITEKIICDSSTTDSINLNSDRNSSPCNIICDIQNVDNVDILGTSEIVDNSVGTTCEPTVEKNSSLVAGYSVDKYTTQLSEHDRSRRNDSCSTHSEEAAMNRMGIGLCENRIADTLYNVNDNHNVTGSKQLENMAISRHAAKTNSPEEERNVGACHSDNILNPESTIIEDKVHSSTPVLHTIFKDNVSDIENGDAVRDRDSPYLYDTPIDNYTSNDIILDEESSVLGKLNHFPPFAKRIDVTENNLVDGIRDEPAQPVPIKTHSKSHEKSIIESPSPVVSPKESLDFDRSDADELIFNMTDISTGTTLDDEVSSLDFALNQTNESIKMHQSNSSPGLVFNKHRLKSHLSQAMQSPTNLFIEKSKDIHRNSHDSGIEETILSLTEKLMLPIFQESTDSGIDSECSSVCIKVNSGTDMPGDQTMSAEKDAVNNNRHVNDEFIEKQRESMTHKASSVSSEITTKKVSEHRSVNTESHTSIEIVKTMVVTSVCSRSERAESKSSESHETIEKLLAEVGSERRDTEMSGCPAVVCSTSPE